MGVGHKRLRSNQRSSSRAKRCDESVRRLVLQHGAKKFRRYCGVGFASTVLQYPGECRQWRQRYFSRRMARTGAQEWRRYCVGIQFLRPVQCSGFVDQRRHGHRRRRLLQHGTQGWRGASLWYFGHQPVGLGHPGYSHGGAQWRERHCRRPLARPRLEERQSDCLGRAT